MLDPWLDKLDLSVVPPEERGAMLEHGFDPVRMREMVSQMEPVPGLWPMTASLTRFRRDHMDARQLASFNAKVKPADLGWISPCWIWDAGTHDKGYGRFYLGRDPDTKQKIWSYSHRIAFEHWIAFPPAGHIVDHQCNNKVCCNPLHLWPVTNDENLRLADQRRPWKRRNQFSKE